VQKREEDVARREQLLEGVRLLLALAIFTTESSLIIFLRNVLLLGVALEPHPTLRLASNITHSSVDDIIVYCSTAILHRTAAHYYDA
jgi:hypothetical protein